MVMLTAHLCKRVEEWRVDKNDRWSNWRHGAVDMLCIIPFTPMVLALLLLMLDCIFAVVVLGRIAFLFNCCWILL
jgi:hypothetical protein